MFLRSFIGGVIFISFVSIFPTPIYAKDPLNLHVLGGVVGSFVSVPNRVTSPGFGWALAILPDFCTSDRLCWEAGVIINNRRFVLDGVSQRWMYVQVAPLIRYFVLADLLSIGGSIYYSRLLEGGGTFPSNEFGGLISVRWNLDLFSAGPLAVGLVLEARGLGGLGIGANRAQYTDGQLLAGVRFGIP